MSVFIHIKEAEIDEGVQAEQVAIKIRSRDTELNVEPVPTFPSSSLDCSFISSIKEQHLSFELILIQQQKPETRTLTAELSFSPLHFTPEKEISQSMNFDGQAKLHLDIFFTKKKNFLGPIEFYEYQNVAASSVIIHKEERRAEIKSGSQVQLKSAAPVVRTPISNRTNVNFHYGKPLEKPVSSGGVFFCCGENNEQQKFEVEDIDERPGENYGGQAYTTFPKQLKAESNKVEFYQGACQSKNMFSMCDVPVNDNKFTIVEDYYRDKQP